MLRTTAHVKLHFDAVFHYVSDLDRAIRFYADVLGLELHSRDYVARFYIDGVLFELVPTLDEHKLQGDGNGRLCFQVEDIQAAVAELRARRVPSAPRRNEGQRYVTFLS